MYIVRDKVSELVWTGDQWSNQERMAKRYASEKHARKVAKAKLGAVVEEV